MTNLFKIVNRSTVEMRLEKENKYHFYKCFKEYLIKNGLDLEYKTLKEMFGYTGKVVFKGELGKDFADLFINVLELSKKIEHGEIDINTILEEKD